MNFQIGDKVKIISLSKLEELSPKPWDYQYPFVSKEGCAFTEDMLDFCGLIGTIINICNCSICTVYFYCFYTVV